MKSDTPNQRVVVYMPLTERRQAKATAAQEGKTLSQWFREIASQNIDNQSRRSA